jgi:hypothetical protein
MTLGCVTSVSATDAKALATCHNPTRQRLVSRPSVDSLHHTEALSPYYGLDLIFMCDHQRVIKIIDIIHEPRVPTDLSTQTFLRCDCALPPLADDFHSPIKFRGVWFHCPPSASDNH